MFNFVHGRLRENRHLSSARIQRASQALRWTDLLCPPRSFASNGEQRQSSNTRHLIFNIWDQIEHLSGAMTLEPGDLIFTGTPGGIGAAMEPRQFLKDGDVVRIEIDSLGAIENPCANEV